MLVTAGMIPQPAAMSSQLRPCARRKLFPCQRCRSFAQITSSASRCNFFPPHSMNRTPLFLLSCSFVLNGAQVARASLATWQTAVGVGTAPVTTVFTPTSGASPALVNVGALTDDRSFEFIYNAGPTVAGSQALLGSQAGASGVQGLK